MKRALLAIALGAGFYLPVKAMAADPEVIVYYFHGNARCASCYKLEQYTQEAVAGNFKAEVASGEVVFSPVNVEQKENAHFVGDYQLYTKSVVVSRREGAKELSHEVLMEAWEYLGNKPKFIEYVTGRIRASLRKE